MFEIIGFESVSMNFLLQLKLPVFDCVYPLAHTRRFYINELLKVCCALHPKMFRLSLLLLAIALSVFFLAHPSRGVPTIQEENGSLARGLLHDPPKRRLTSLKSNTNQTILYGQDSNSWDVEHFAQHHTYSGGPDDNYYGLLAMMDVYGHELQRGQKSSTAISIYNVGDGARSSLNFIEAGWHIYPELYGDSRTHFYTYWTRDGEQATGCFNMDCGFVPAKGATVAPGALIDPVSDAKNGRIQNITLKVFKDQSSGDWWVYYGFNSVPTAVGYYPRSLFTYLQEKANDIAFGAFVDAQRTLPTPPMGSGVQPNAGQGRAASFTGLYLVDQYGNSNPIMGDLPSRVDVGNCYSITPVARAEFFYGGPGGCV